MNIATMVDFVDMIKKLDNEDVTIDDWVFCEDGKSVFVELTNGESYRFAVM